MQNKSSNRSGKCTHCNKTCFQTVYYSKKNLEHRRCSECGEVSVFGYVTAEGNGVPERKEWMLLDFGQIMNRRTTDFVPRYLIQTDYKDGEYLHHPQFGNGYVLEILPPRKMRVLFDGRTSLLMCGSRSTDVSGTPTDQHKRKKRK